MSAREEILARIRAADRSAAPELDRTYDRAGRLAAAERVDRFCERVADYGATIHRVAPPSLASALADACAGLRIAIPPTLSARLRPTGCDLVPDDDLSPVELDRLDGSLTGCSVAIAETGTIVLASGPEEGRRALTLVPDLHVCVVHEDQVVETVPEGLAAAAGLVRGERRPLTLVSGPSATSDIELSRVEGVHGPRRLVVLLVAAHAHTR